MEQSEIEKKIYRFADELSQDEWKTFVKILGEKIIESLAISLRVKKEVDIEKEYYKDIDGATTEFLRDNQDELKKIITKHIGKKTKDIFNCVEKEFDLKNEIIEFADEIFPRMLDYGNCGDCKCETEGAGRIIAASHNLETNSEVWGEGKLAEILEKPAQILEAIAFFTVRNDLAIAIGKEIERMIVNMQKEKK